MGIGETIRGRRNAATRGRAVRKKARLSLAEMAAEVPISEASLSRWETGVCLPRGEAAARYQRLLERIERELDEGPDAG
jgi:transcriptional regulator with XRE-family HTH domain